MCHFVSRHGQPIALMGPPQLLVVGEAHALRGDQLGPAAVRDPEIVPPLTAHHHGGFSPGAGLQRACSLIRRHTLGTVPHFYSDAFRHRVLLLKRGQRDVLHAVVLHDFLVAEVGDAAAAHLGPSGKWNGARGCRFEQVRHPLVGFPAGGINQIASQHPVHVGVALGVDFSECRRDVGQKAAGYSDAAVVAWPCRRMRPWDRRISGSACAQTLRE